MVKSLYPLAQFATEARPSTLAMYLRRQYLEDPTEYL
jgi:hypothetical protein